MEQSIARHFIFINNPAFLFSVITQTLGFTLNTVGGAPLPGGSFRLGWRREQVDGSDETGRYRGEAGEASGASLAWTPQSLSLSSPDAIFTGSTKCLSITQVVIEREMNVGRVQRAGKQQCNAIRGRKRGPVSFHLTGLELSGERGAGE